MKHQLFKKNRYVTFKIADNVKIIAQIKSSQLHKLNITFESLDSIFNIPDYYIELKPVMRYANNNTSPSKGATNSILKRHEDFITLIKISKLDFATEEEKKQLYKYNQTKSQVK